MLRTLLSISALVFCAHPGFSQAYIAVKGVLFPVSGISGGELMGKTGNPATFEGFFHLDTLQKTLVSTIVKHLEDFETVDQVDFEQFTIRLEDINTTDFPDGPVYDDTTFKTPYYFVDFLSKELEQSVEHLVCLHDAASETLELAPSPVWIRFYFLEEKTADEFIKQVKTELKMKYHEK